MTIDLDAIEAAARAATPGEWEAVEDAASGDCIVVVAGPPRPGFAQYRIALDVNGDRRGPDAQGASPQQNAHHIATMDPATTLALVERVRELESQRHDALRSVDALLGLISADRLHGIDPNDSDVCEARELLSRMEIDQ